MKISFLIPTKDGGEGFVKLVESIKSNISYALGHGHDFEYDVTLVINGDPRKPLSHIESNKDIIDFVKVEQVKFLGKIKSINYCLKNNNSDIIAILDDDVYFDKELLSLALDNLGSNKLLKLIAFQTRALPYSGYNPLSRFFYDVINIRSLKRLYKGTDPFLFGRFLVARRDALNVPDEVINEDLYLSLINDGHYIIRSEEVFYKGEHSLFSHTKRVLRIEAGRRQARAIFGSSYDEITAKYKREVDLEKLNNLDLYYKVSYYCYCVLRFFTNSIVARLFSHKTSHW